MRWNERQSDGTVGAYLDRGTFPGNFEFDRDFGAVFAGHSDNVMFEATMDVVVQRSGHVGFTMNGDDGFELALDGDVLIDEWHSGGLRSDDPSKFEFLKPGLHTLRLRYFQGIGESILRFETDPDILQWTEVVCSGTRSFLPPVCYFVFDAAGMTVPSVSARFDLPGPAVFDLNPQVSLSPAIPGRILLPGSAEPEQNRKLIVIQGVNSSAEVAISADPPNFGFRRHLILSRLQTWPDSDGAFFDEEDVIGFSYRDSYHDATSGRNVSGKEYDPGHLLIPVYDGNDTCSGVAASASKLDWLVKRISEVEPDASIDFLGHSMGGMVIAFWISQQDSEFLRRHIRSFVTLDSPLFDGHPGFMPGSCNPFSSQAWRDINNSDRLALSSINNYSKTTQRVSFYHINSSAIGDVLPGGVSLPGSCGVVSTNPILLLFSYPFHSCLWEETKTLDWIARVIFTPESINLPPRAVPTAKPMPTPTIMPTNTPTPPPTPTPTTLPTPVPTVTPTPTPTQVDSLDSDGDGLIDSEELRLGTNPFSVDTDSDGLSDLLEVQLLTDPLSADTDSDGLLDGDEVNRGTDPLRFDTDADGLSDGDEVNIYGTNPLFEDTDLDGVNDGIDLFPLADASVAV